VAALPDDPARISFRPPVSTAGYIDAATLLFAREANDPDRAAEIHSRQCPQADQR
jgi:hypothetical protein